MRGDFASKIFFLDSGHIIKVRISIHHIYIRLVCASIMCPVETGYLNCKQSIRVSIQSMCDLLVTDTLNRFPRLQIKALSKTRFLTLKRTRKFSNTLFCMWKLFPISLSFFSFSKRKVKNFLYIRAHAENFESD